MHTRFAAKIIMYRIKPFKGIRPVPALAEVGSDAVRQIELAYQLALCRPPTAQELALMREFLRQESLEQMCRVIFNLNEFVYTD